jgi:cytochrome c oxidase subunit II
MGRAQAIAEWRAPEEVRRPMIDPRSVDSTMVLWGQTIVYTLYALAVLIVMGVFAYKVSHPGKSKSVRQGFFVGWACMLVVVGVSLHLVTYNTIPWASLDLNPGNTQIDKTFDITVAEHRFSLPSEKLSIDCGDVVKFGVTYKDLTYGFGLFRQDHSMLFQMQVVPGHANDLLWRFEKNGVYDIRSTEYSGPAGAQMIVPRAVEVTGCTAG